MKYTHLFQNDEEFNEKYNGDNYFEPWVSLTRKSLTPIGDCSSIVVDAWVYDPESGEDVKSAVTAYFFGEYVEYETYYQFTTDIETYTVTNTGTTEIEPGDVRPTLETDFLPGATFIMDIWGDYGDGANWNYSDPETGNYYWVFTRTTNPQVGDDALTSSDNAYWFDFNKRNPSVGEVDNNGNQVLSVHYDSYEESDLNRIDYNKHVPKGLKQPLTFEIISGGSIYWAYSNYWYEDPLTIEYRKNGGEWTEITATEQYEYGEIHYGTEIQVADGDILEFRGDNKQYGESTGYSFYDCGHQFNNSQDCKFKVYGNILSMSNSSDFENASLVQGGNGQFAHLFYNAYGLVDASGLILPDTDLNTTDGCYGCMFMYCSSLTGAPQLPATILGTACYKGMFYGCSSLEIAPELSADEVSYIGYELMFYDCYNLNYVKCLARSFTDQSSAVGQWLDGVAQNGTFIAYDCDAPWGTWDIPQNWTVYDKDGNIITCFDNGN